MAKKTTIFILSLLISINLSAQNTYVFVGSYSLDNTQEGIYVYQLTPKGALKKITSVKVHNASYLNLSPDGKYLYACTDTKTPNAGSISSYAFDTQQKTLTFINSQRSGGENPVYLSVHQSGKWLVNANYTEGSASVYSLENGKISPFVQNFQYTTEHSIDPKRQERSHVHSAVFSPKNDYVFLPDLGADKIRCYQFDSSQKQPLQETPYPFTQTVAGSGPRHFTFHPNGKIAYCIEELSGTVSVYAYENGKLTSIQRIEAHTSQYTDGFGSADIHLSPDSKFLYASNRGKENTIAIFSIEKDGTLKTVGYQSTLGEHPRMFGIDPTGKFVIVANQVSGDVVVFKRNAKTGLLKKVGNSIKIHEPSCVQIRQY